MPEKKKHIGIYLPAELLRRLAEYQFKKTGSTYGRNEVIIQAIEDFLKRNRV